MNYVFYTKKQSLYIEQIHFKICHRITLLFVTRFTRFSD